MKNKKHIIGPVRRVGFLTASLFLAGCGGNTIPVNFENFSFNLETDGTFNQTVSDGISNPIIKSYIDTSTTGFVDSLLISKTNIKGIALDSFVTENLKTTQKEYGYYNPKSKYLNFQCSGEVINGKLESFYNNIKENNATSKTIYFGQYFFVTNSGGYIVSFGSDDQSLRNDFLDSIPSLKCE